MSYPRCPALVGHVEKKCKSSWPFYGALLAPTGSRSSDATITVYHGNIKQQKRDVPSSDSSHHQKRNYRLTSQCSRSTVTQSDGCTALLLREHQRWARHELSQSCRLHPCACCRLIPHLSIVYVSHEKVRVVISVVYMHILPSHHCGKSRAKHPPEVADDRDLRMDKARDADTILLHVDQTCTVTSSTSRAIQSFEFWRRAIFPAYRADCILDYMCIRVNPEMLSGTLKRSNRGWVCRKCICCSEDFECSVQIVRRMFPGPLSMLTEVQSLCGRKWMSNVAHVRSLCGRKSKISTEGPRTEMPGR